MKPNNSKKLKMRSLLSLLIMVVGIGLMVYMIVIENEPGAIPLLLILTGAGGYLITKTRRHLQQK